MEIASKPYLSLYSDFRPDIREKVLDYVKNKYGEKSVCCIMTRGRQMARAAVRNCARLLGDEKYQDTTVFLSLGDEIAKAIPEELGIKLNDCVKDLRDKFAANEDALTIINNSLLVEETFTNVGMHAAGVIISDNGDVSEYVPLMYLSSNDQMVTQFDKDVNESLGLLKMDFLGLRNLGIINECVRTIKEKYGISIDIERVPFEPAVFSKIFAEGNTTSVFQFESQGMKQMLRQFKPETIEDVVLLVAAYRPGPLQYLESIIAVKNGKKKPEYVIPEMEEILGTTYGSPIYQEQIMAIFNKFAGFSLGEADIIRRYMSKKKTEKFMAYKDKFVEGMVARGGQPQKVEEFWDQLVDFSKYAFNSSHATAYAFVAYYTAWLKYKYPKEFLCAVMNDTEFEKLSGLMSDCKTFNIKVLPPDINESKNGFSVKDGCIVCGLGKVKNVGNAALPIIEDRTINGAYTSFANFMLRTRTKKDAVESLIKAGAFDFFTRSRNALLSSFENYATMIKKIKEKEKALCETEFANDEKAVAKRERALAAIETAKANLNAIAINTPDEEDVFERLTVEKEMLGAYVSAHPLDSYKAPEELGCLPIAQLQNGKRYTIMGLVSNMRRTFRKSDGKPMAFFKLEDKTGVVDVCCFTKAYEQFGNMIDEDLVIKIYGKCSENVDSYTDEVTLQVSLEKVETVEQTKPNILLSVNSIMSWTDDVYKKVCPYSVKSGYPLFVLDKLTGRIRKTALFVSGEIFDSGFEVTFM